MLVSISDIAALPLCFALLSRILADKTRSLVLSRPYQMEHYGYFGFISSLSLSPLSVAFRCHHFRGWRVGAECVFVCRHRCFGTEAPLKVQTRRPQSQPLSSATIKTSISHHTESNKKRTPDAHVRTHTCTDTEQS